MRAFSRAAAVATTICLGAPAASAALLDGNYDLVFTESVLDAELTGSFAVIGGAISDLTVSSAFIGGTQVYSGPGTNGSTGTMLSATLTTVDLSGLTTPSTFALAEDGTFICTGWIGRSACLLASASAGSASGVGNALTGTYEIVSTASPVPLPAGLPLALTALAGLATLRRWT